MFPFQGRVKLTQSQNLSVRNGHKFSTKIVLSSFSVYLAVVTNHFDYCMFSIKKKHICVADPSDKIFFRSLGKPSKNPVFYGKADVINLSFCWLDFFRKWLTLMQRAVLQHCITVCIVIQLIFCLALKNFQTIYFSETVSKAATFWGHFPQINF